MNHVEQIASTFFNRLGYAVDVIPTSSNKRADLAVFDGINRYIVEIKEKFQTDSKVSYSTEGEGASLVHVRSEPHARSNRLDGVFKDGAKQLSETPSSSSAFRLIWLHCEGPHADMIGYRALYTFYGVEQLVPCSSRGEGVNCVYFNHSTAFAKPSINGLVIVENDSLQLCLNEFSTNYESFKVSKLVQTLGDAIYDPKCFDDRKGTIVLRSDISRGAESEVLMELERLTGVRYRTISLHQYSFS